MKTKNKWFNVEWYSLERIYPGKEGGYYPAKDLGKVLHRLKIELKKGNIKWFKITPLKGDKYEKGGYIWKGT